MAITKIHPIKSTLHLAINYIVNEEKTDEQLLVSTHKCHESSAHTQFLRTRGEAGTKGTVLARHLIQSFLPGETTPEMAHQIGMELCKKILKDEYEFVLSTHIDKGHIHNHIIFNNVNMVTGRCYQSNKKSYHKIRYQSDKLCKENNLSVIDEFYESYKKKYKTNGKSWYENEQAKKGTSWKSRLQFDIDRIIKQSQDWDEFLKKMAELGYEIKHGKHIAFKPKDKPRFTRAKTIGEDYTEERLKDRIAEKLSIKTPAVKKRIGRIIDMNTSIKVKESKGYEYWATKHNLNTMAESVIFLREQGIKSVKQLDEYIQKAADEKQNLQDKIKAIEKEMQELSATMEQVHTVKKYRQYYKEYKASPSDKAFFEEYKAQITLYENALSELKKSYSKLPNSKGILDRLDKLQEKKNTLMQEYSSSKSIIDELYKIRKNYGIYMGKEMER
ncbi:TPA: relaxase/mobilization nuclease domain-containing protein [Streptococcus equi subsp. zooepidemicus]|uniref:relaxase/mobilization nuclease domain-containing protein n=1 Tax=Streptococcus equi TaxID=1336 RepID=UPI001E554338|nr:relaxase/mobilization nuclease domain-containing protein [Streptococcus equi]MCD3467316.1 relaxase/mobilization nuclease domain-containing protein [Streptococcus equi subsp. zooepidemicus]HEL0548275.1 relaxase/mobilization nuclease domain-containing protein [Streptococcus equi subsp. zooepidemicus]HEL1063132.1 relaxase/mobilization nuclease domain-containing protein [Streptococcus equi subsp. zooepidemicus]HEL1157239.1 relaxase/mobilization nuclease domain-containing protein [Streptococcus e